MERGGKKITLASGPVPADRDFVLTWRAAPLAAPAIGAAAGALDSFIEQNSTRVSAYGGPPAGKNPALQRQLARALAWADVYLLSSLGTDLVEDLSMIALGRPEEARRLAASCGSCLVVNQAEWTRPIVAEDAKE